MTDKTIWQKPVYRSIRQLHHLSFCSQSVLAFLLSLAFLQNSGAQTYSFSNVWTVANGATGTHIATGDVNRGLAYSAPSNQVFVVNKGITGTGTTPAIDVFDGTSAM